MFKQTEITAIILSIIVLTFGITFMHILTQTISLEIILFNLIAISLVLLTNVFSKKITAHYFEARAYVKLWESQRYGFKKGYQFKKPVPVGFILSFLVPLMTMGYAFWMAVLEFDITIHPSRASKRHEWYKFSEMTDWHLGIIAIGGIVGNLLLAIITYVADVSEIAKLSIYFAAFSIIPLSNLDGAKIFFARKNLWITITIIVGIFLAFSILIP